MDHPTTEETMERKYKTAKDYLSAIYPVAMKCGLDVEDVDPDNTVLVEGIEEVAGDIKQYNENSAYEDHTHMLARAYLEEWSPELLLKYATEQSVWPNPAEENPKYITLKAVIQSNADGETEDMADFHKLSQKILKAKPADIVYLCPELSPEGWAEFWAKAGSRVVDIGKHTTEKTSMFTYRVKTLNLCESYHSTKGIKFIHSSDESLDGGDGIEAVHIRKSDYARLMEE